VGRPASVALHRLRRLLRARRKALESKKRNHLRHAGTFASGACNGLGENYDLPAGVKIVENESK
jgi:hypothetical protein